MAEDDRLSGPLQESLLTALAYRGKEASIITSLLGVEHFESPYRDIVSRIIDYRVRNGEPPGVGHIDDLFDDILGDSNHKKYATTNRILVSMRELADHLNCGYVVSRVRDFARRQTLKSGILAASERWQEGGDTVVEDVEAILNDTLKDKPNNIDIGTHFTDIDRVFAYQEVEAHNYVQTHIPQLDRYEAVPRCGELMMFIAPPKRGKSWFCHHIGRASVIQGCKTLHITLENSEHVVNPRYLQSFFKLGKRMEEKKYTRFDFDKEGNLQFKYRETKPNFLIDDRDLRSKLKMNEIGFRNLIVKQFPTGTLTVQQLDNYLDYLQAAINFIPHVVILDSPYLMKIPRTDYRLNLGQTVVELRGLAVKRNFALVATHQGNRESATARSTREGHVAEDYSIVATSDIVITYSQTARERRLQVARLYVSNSRKDIDQFTVLISQNYATGQFKLDSVLWQEKDYFEKIEAEAGKFDEKEAA